MSDTKPLDQVLAETLTEMVLQLNDYLREDERKRIKAATTPLERLGGHDHAQLAAVAATTTTAAVLGALVQTAEQMLPGFADAFFQRLSITTQNEGET